jgi:hypothetical protein
MRVSLKQTVCGMDAASEPTRMYSRRVCFRDTRMTYAYANN